MAALFVFLIQYCFLFAVSVSTFKLGLPQMKMTLHKGKVEAYNQFKHILR